MNLWIHILVAAVSLTASLHSFTQTPKFSDPILVIDSGGHTSRVGTVLLSRDESQIISVSRDKTIRFWDAKTGLQIRTLRPPMGHTLYGELNTGALSLNGEILAVAGRGVAQKSMPIYLIRLSDGQMETVLYGHEAEVSSLKFSPDGKSLASGSSDKTCRIWNVVEGKCEQVLEGHKDSIECIDFDREGKRIAIASRDKTIRIWDLKTGMTTAILVGHEQEVMAVAWSANNKMLVSGGIDKSLLYWSPEGKLVMGSTGIPGWIYSVQFINEDKEVLFTMGTIASIGGFAACANAKNIRLTVPHTSAVHSASIFRDGHRAVSSGGVNQELLVWNLTDGKRLMTLKGKGTANWAASWSDDGTQIA